MNKLQLSQKDNVPEYWLKTAVDKYYNPKKYYVPEKVEVKPTFQQLPDEFLLKHKLSEVRKKNFRVICRAMMRYELMNVPTEHLFTLHLKNEISCLRKICQTIRN